MTGATLADVAGAKRLLFESQTVVLASLQEQVNGTDASSIKKVPVVERETKMKAIKKRLTGLLIEGLEPGHGLLDTTASVMQLNEIKYIPPEKCISRTYEVLNQKSLTKQLDISAENLIVKEKQDTPDMTVTSACCHRPDCVADAPSSVAKEQIFNGFQSVWRGNLFWIQSSSGCSEAADGAKCRRGLHVCAKCYGMHGIQKHESTSRKQIMVRALHVIYQNDVWKVQTIFLLQIFRFSCVE